MITLYGFGPYFSCPDASPFVIKAMLLLKFAGLTFDKDTNGFQKAPKGKLPYINDDGEIIADSTLIRFHIERKYKFDFDAMLGAEQKAIGWAFEKMCEEHLYWGLLDLRWMNDANFKKGPVNFFNAIPMPIRILVQKMVRKKVKNSLWAQGFGRHSAQDMLEFSRRDIDAIAALLGDKPYLFGGTPCAADASVVSMLIALRSPHFESPLRAAVERHANLRAYCERILGEYF
jgi:glutathione S-transferase